jgi:hormone-sensitive lipase
MKFELQSRFFEDLDHVFTKLVTKLQGLSDNVGEKEVNEPITLRCLKLVQVYSDQLVAAVDVCERKRKLRKRYMGELTVLDSKLTTITELFDYAVEMDAEDLFCKGKDHPRWQSLLRNVRIHTFEQPALLQKHMQKIIYSISAGNAFVSKAFERTGKTSRKLMMGLGAVYYTAAKKKALRKARFSLAKPDIEIAKITWNLMDSKLMAPMLEKMTVDIHVNKLIFVPRITVKDVEIATSSPAIHSELPADRVNPHFSYEKGEGEERIGIRVLSPFPIPALQGNQQSCGCFGPLHAAGAQGAAPKGVIFHIHGGGFIAMSSRSHQSYTRKWANELQTVIFSVDYRLAPEHAFPAAVDDVWAAYLWVFGFAKRYLGISTDKIVVTGDSAGGNLACGLINKAIESGNPRLVPRGGLLTYPALSLSLARYSPSFEVALEDFIVHHTFLKICLKSYLQDSTIDANSDYYASPLVTPDANLRLFPPIRIMVGNCDPLEDDCWRFGERLLGVGVDFGMVLYEGFPHGFLGFDLKFNGVRETREAVEQGSRYLRELMEAEEAEVRINS